MEYVFLILISAVNRFDIDFRSFIREVGFELSDDKLGRGYQDAIVPPKLNWISIFCYFVLFGIIISIFNKSVSSGFISILVYLLTVTTVGIIIHPPGKSKIFRNFYLEKLYSSMVNRYADYKKENDDVRADAIYPLIKKFEKKLLKKI